MAEPLELDGDESVLDVAARTEATALPLAHRLPNECGLARISHHRS